MALFLCSIFFGGRVSLWFRSPVSRVVRPGGLRIEDEINILIANLKFSEEESQKISCPIVEGMDTSGYKAWAVGKILSKVKINKEAMYRVFRSLWFTKKGVGFVELEGGTFLVKFGCLEDRDRIMSMAPWMFDQCLFSMVPFEKDKEIETYEFKLVPFFIRIFNVPIEYMERQMALEISKAVGEVLAIDWRDRDRCWTKFMRVLIKLDTSKALRRVVCLKGNDGKEFVCFIKYERLPTFCYICGRVGHNT